MAKINRNHYMNKIYRKRQKFFLIMKHMTFKKKINRNIVGLGLMIVIYVWDFRVHKEFLDTIYRNQIMNKIYRKKKIYLIMKEMGFGLGLVIRIKIYQKKINNKKVLIPFIQFILKDHNRLN